MPCGDQRRRERIRRHPERGRHAAKGDVVDELP
jgi:hypothetical protein